MGFSQDQQQKRKTTGFPSTNPSRFRELVRNLNDELAAVRGDFNDLRIGRCVALLCLCKEEDIGRLEGKIAVITGGNSGIGLATAKRFVAEGGFVFITARRQVELDKAVSEIGKNITAIRADISKLEEIDRLYKEVAAKKGKIDILFANAGVVEPKPTAENRTSLAEFSFSSAEMPFPDRESAFP